MVPDTSEASVPKWRNIVATRQMAALLVALLEIACDVGLAVVKRRLEIRVVLYDGLKCILRSFDEVLASHSCFGYDLDEVRTYCSARVCFYQTRELLDTT
jgi:hypothetical protein